MIGLLNISEAMSIALHTCVCLADNDGTLSSTRMIAERLGFSPHHSAKVVQHLVRASLLETSRGPAGGVRLARPASSIMLYEIYVAAGGVPEFSGCLLKSDICEGNRCLVGKMLAKENARFMRLLRNTTLENVVRSIVRSPKKKNTQIKKVTGIQKRKHT